MWIRILSIGYDKYKYSELVNVFTTCKHKLKYLNVINLISSSASLSSKLCLFVREICSSRPIKHPKGFIRSQFVWRLLFSKNPLWLSLPITFLHNHSTTAHHSPSPSHTPLQSCLLGECELCSFRWLRKTRFPISPTPNSPDRRSQSTEYYIIWIWDSLSSQLNCF